MIRNGHQGNGHGHVTETPDVSHIKNIDVTHEASDVNVGGIVKFVVGLTIFAIAVQVLMWSMFRFFNAQEAGKEPQPGPMAMTAQERRPPDPKLQSAPGFGVKLENGQWVPLENREPQAEYAVISAEWKQRLNCDYKDHLIGQRADLPYCVPIDKAIQQLLEGNSLRSRASDSAPKRIGRAEDYGIDMPTAASSGRMTEK